MPKSGFVFLGEHFPTKASLYRRIRPLVYAMPMRQPLDGFDLEVALGILAIHHRGAEKIGAGVKHIEVRRNQRSGHPEMWLTRIDGTRPEDFTWASCADGDRPDVYYQHGALRDAIRGQIAEFRRSVFSGPRPVSEKSGALLRNDKSTHIDHHKPTFYELATAFIREDGQVRWADPSDTTTAAVMSDGQQRMRWLDFHRANATLRAITREENLTRRRSLDSAA